MRTWRAFPAIATVGLFLLMGSVLLSSIGPGGRSAAPEEEMWLVYFALVHHGEPPAELGGEVLRGVLEELDPSQGEVAERIEVLSWERRGEAFTLEARHLRSGGTYRITRDGVY